MRKIILPVLILISGKMFAQPCSDEMIRSKQGQWHGFVAGKGAAQEYQLKAMEIFKRALPRPQGFEPNVYALTRDKSMAKNGPLSYQVNVVYNYYYCNQNLNNQIMLADETSTWSYISFNSLGFLFPEKPELSDNDGNSYYRLPRQAGNWKGNPVFTEENNRVKSKIVLFSRNGRMPYRLLTRRSYLAILLAREEKLRSEGITRLKSMPEKSASGESMVQQRNAAILRWSEDHDKRIDLINNVLDNTTNEDLEKPAIVQDFFYNKGFVTEDKGNCMASPNPDYFDNTLPVNAPQIILLKWKWGLYEKIETYIAEELDANIDAEDIRSMLVR